ncbi:hypothetical protein [Streptomyces sp. NPDC126499]|uniref:hypothetical protein n=1 Tax=Streptomyces sp. NPDC126499 TaxID=3155314 RepID=UPI003328E9F5
MTNGRFEEELGAALRRTGAGFETDDRGELVTGGLARGRRRVRRRRFAVVGGALALAVIGVGGVYGGALLGAGDGVDQVSVAAPKPTVGGPKPTAGPKDASAQAQIPVADIAAVLKANTPPGTWQIDNADGFGQSVTGVYDDGEGKAGVSVGLYRAGDTEESGRGQVTCPDEALVPHDDCTSERMAGIGRLMIFQGYEYPDKRVETKNWRAVLLTEDGFLVDVSEWNAATQKDSPISRPNPPFDPAQLKALVLAEGWRPLLKQLPALVPQKGGPGASRVAPPPAPSAAAMQSALRSLLPKGKGLHVVDKGGQEGYAFLVVDDGKGRSFVQINVQPGMDDIRAELFSDGDIEFTADETRVKVTKEAGEKGGKGVVSWTADTLATDGLRVVVSAFNAGAQHEAATRSEPALTTDQLKAIALSPKWRELMTK